MDRLFQGTLEFRKEDFEQHRSLFKELGHHQQPHTLFIGCSDSRVVPHLITSTLPGELFVVRNIANLVPLYRRTEEFYATTSAIEYAVAVLNVKSIVVCGHSNCGGCASMYLPEESFAETPHVRKWLQLAYSVKERVLQTVDPNDFAARDWLTEQLNIVEQMKHLLTFPMVLRRYVAGDLSILGWYYIIDTGEVFNYNQDKSVFELIEDVKPDDTLTKDHPLL